MKVLLALALVCAVALAQVTTIDNFTVDQDPLSVNGPAPSASTTANDAGIFGGRRTTTLDLAAASVSTCRTGLSSTTNISPTGFLDANADGVNDNPGDLGIFIAANDQSCFAKAVLSYQGTGTALTGANRNLNNIGAAFHIRYYSDLGARQLLLKVNTGVSTCSATLTTTGSQNVDDKTIPFGSFSTGCDFSNADSVQIEVPAQSNFDVTISIFEFVAASLSGRVYNDCACDNTFNGNDTPVLGQTVTATPGNNCGGAPTKTTSTDASGNYRFTGLATCSYTISISATTCGNSPSSQTRTTSISAEVTNVNFALPVSSILTPPGPDTYECDEPIQPTQATLSSQCGTTAVTTFTDATTTQAVCASNGNPAVNRVITRTFSAAGQTATQTITVITDRQAPSYTNPADATITCQQFPSDPNTTPIPTSLSGAPAMTDNCSTPSFTFVDSITQVCDTTVCGSSFNIIRTFSVRDSCGNGPVSSGTQRITRGACSSTGSFICPIQSVCGVNPPPPPPPNVPPPPPQTGECNGNTNSRTTNTLSQDVTIPTNSLTTVEITNSRSTLTSDDITNASLLTNSRTTLTTAENVAGNTNTKTTITSDDFTGASLATNSRTSLTNSENLAGSPTPNTSNDSPLAVDSSANSPNESPANSNSGSPANSNSGNNSPNNSNSNNNSNSGNNNSSNNSSATSLAASLVALVALFFLF